MNSVLAIVLAGGAGERLHPLTQDRAKPAVPFGGIYRAEDIARDPHYEARQNIAHVPDETLGEVAMPAVSPRLEGTPGRITHAGPEIGAHTAEIYGGLLGKTEAVLDALREAGVI